MTYTKTSQEDPIILAYLPANLPGRLSLTIAPGKHGPSKGGYHWRRDLGTDLDRLVKELDTDVLVCLLEDDEMTWLKIPTLVSEAEQRGMEVMRLPIPDGGTPPRIESVEALTRGIVARLRAGQNVVIHCAGGLGRSGTVAGCVLVELGMSAEEALVALVSARGRRCPENEAQKNLIRNYALRNFTSIDTKISGAVLGAAIGDAMGNPTEFLSMADIRQRYGKTGVAKFERFIEQDGKRVAPYTDDTQMAEAVARGLLEGLQSGGDLDGSMKSIAKRFVEWSKHPQGGHRAPGSACLAGCRALDRGEHWSVAGGPSAGGCGSVMRAYPFGLFFHGDLEKAETWAVAHSKLTHRDPIALAACAAMAVGVARTLCGESATTVAGQMVAAASRYSPQTADMMARAIREAGDGTDPALTLDRLRGWAAHEAIAAAVFVFLRHPDDPRAAILEAINSPGDSDSLGTLVGALVGARCGVARLPEEWVEQVERSDALRELAEAIAAGAMR